MERFQIREADKKVWGVLVKAWAKGEKAKPANLDELKQHMEAAGMSPLPYPDYLKGLVFVQNDKHVLTVRLPPKELVEAGEAALDAATGAYPLPAFYDEFYVNNARRTNFSATERRELQSARIGEYSVNSCA
jgi:hypothetical protein